MNQIGTVESIGKHIGKNYVVLYVTIFLCGSKNFAARFCPIKVQNVQGSDTTEAQYLFRSWSHKKILTFKRINQLHMKKKKFFMLAITGAALALNLLASPTHLKFRNMKDTSADNQLTATEKKEGWKLLFDGKTLNGWKTYKNIPNASWKATDGALCSDKPSGDKNPDLMTNDMYGNFELSIDWKISAKGNSGIMYLVTEDHDQSYESGPEYQLIDNKGFEGQIEEDQKASANYAMQAPSVDATKTPGEWNHTVIIVNKGHVEHWLNGQKTVEYELGSEKWKQQKAAGKWKDEAGYGAAKSGHIALQATHSGVENTGICFKNIKIKML